MRATPRPTDEDRLVALAAWLDHASRWLESQVRGSRAARPSSGGDADPGRRVEVVTFRTAELDAAVEGLRRATDVLAALAAPLPNPIVPTRGRAYAPAAKRPHAHLRLVSESEHDR